VSVGLAGGYEPHDPVFVGFGEFNCTIRFATVHCNHDGYELVDSAQKKLADNFENHLRISEAGGIQALLRLGRARSTDEELQYKAALTVAHLASNAAKLLPKGKGSSSSSGIGAGAAMMHSIRSSSGGNKKGAETALAKQQQAVAKRCQKLTQQYMDMALAK
jgi:hypothetical protein